MTPRTTIDWWDFRTKAQPLSVLAGFQAAYGRGAGGEVRLVARSGGWMGYAESADLCIGDMSVGMLAFGGDSQRGWTFARLSGKGCQWLPDLDQAQEALEALPRYQARRIDIALTTADGSIGHDSVLAAYERGGFAAPGGGRPPKMTQITGSEKTDGRTIYVGSRERDKFFRAYEKGYELARPLLSKGIDVTAIDGKPIADVYRLELELKAKTCDLPADLIERRDQYFAGAYPYLQTVLEVEPEILVMRRERGPQLDLAGALANIRHQYGATLFTALVAHHGDMGAVWSKVVGREHSRALLEAGVLLVDHE